MTNAVMFKPLFDIMRNILKMSQQLNFPNSRVHLKSILFKSITSISNQYIVFTLAIQVILSLCMPFPFVYMYVWMAKCFNIYLLITKVWVNVCIFNVCIFIIILQHTAFFKKGWSFRNYSFTSDFENICHVQVTGPN